MNRTTFTVTLLAMCLLSVASAVEYNRLVWQDEFNGDKLDTSKWQYENHCNPQNNELQCYTNRESNVYVKGGYLHVTARPENYGGRKYTSGRINTKHSAAWKYGRFEVRAKLPRGDYLWPALWMLPRDYVYGGWAASGEIDIMEARGQNPRQVSNALHYGGAWPNNAHVGSGAMNFNFDFTEDFHIFTLIWERDQVQWLVDGKVVSTRSLTKNWFSGKGKNPYTDIRQPFDQPFFFLINTAIGGNFFGDQSQALTTAIAQKWQNPDFLVDYVRVYQEGGVIPNPVPVPTTPKTSTSAVKTSSSAPKTSTSAVKTSTTAQQPSLSSGVRSAVSTAASTVISTAASSAVKTAASSAGTTFVYSASGNVPPKTSANTPASSTVTENEDKACAGKCGSQSCCSDQTLGAICYNPLTYVCARDFNGKLTLCGKGLGACNQVCYDLKNYTCSKGVLSHV